MTLATRVAVMAAPCTDIDRFAVVVDASCAGYGSM